ncbi:MAG: rRNA pseudouridine2604 synthase [Candidatus Methanomethylophilaceae archaeon]|nr:rRNA pseudouridine2604 synthase [Candidatus Methanomethylophilaceae archaeon]
MLGYAIPMVSPENEDRGARLNKYISDSGVASRRAADRIIEEGRVTIDGRTAVLGDRVPSGADVRVDGEKILPETDDIILAFNKPVGITCTSNPEDPDNVIDFIGYPKRIYSVGRLDKDSEGLILMTNNGELADRIMHSSSGHEKEYIVTVDKDITDKFLRNMASGVPIMGGSHVTRKCFVEPTGKREFRIILKQGLNRQIRRMCEELDYTATGVRRIRIMNIEIGNMKVGRYRDLTKAERAELYRQLGL